MNLCTAPETHSQDTRPGSPAIDQEQAWDTLMASISQMGDMDAKPLLDILAEADVLMTLNMAEAVMAKLQVVEGLGERFEKGGGENAVLCHLSRHPWLVSPKWDAFSVEHGVKTWMQQAANEAGMDTQVDFRDRFDLALAKGGHLLVLVFMSPGCSLDWDPCGPF